MDWSSGLVICSDGHRGRVEFTFVYLNVSESLKWADIHCGTGVDERPLHGMIVEVHCYMQGIWQVSLRKGNNGSTKGDGGATRLPEWMAQRRLLSFRRFRSLASLANAPGLL